MVAVLILLGGYYAATDGVLPALVSAVLPQELRGSGLGLVATAVSLARLVASVAFGWLWFTRGAPAALVAFAMAAPGHRRQRMGFAPSRPGDNRVMTWRGWVLVAVIATAGSAASAYYALAPRRPCPPGVPGTPPAETPRLSVHLRGRS